MSRTLAQITADMTAAHDAGDWDAVGRLATEFYAVASAPTRRI